MNLRFPGQWFDKETGLYHNGFRDYNPSTGRYMQSDPLGLEAGFNTYTYVGSNPVRAVDPYGLLINFDESIQSVGKFYLDNLKVSSKAANKIISYLEDSNIDIRVHCSLNSSRRQQNVYWNASQTFVDKSGNILADGQLSLFHELYHVYQNLGQVNYNLLRIKQMWAYMTWSDADYKRWTNAAEKDAIDKESLVWREMGNKNFRESHNGNYPGYEFSIIFKNKNLFSEK